ncbi:hypothetical protein AZE42_12257 [Rhizopogon vesiculosus]|uniref:ABM domain-containing protein n=1 Tax=Rhizopogon vesiculosus TaxID=180088 RepID=A0A1J8QLH2_9AGAM|nr:hypothetical protein AZE42_12257 [Rhizopogon vesiculosus]
MSKPTTEVLIFDTSEAHRKDILAIASTACDIVYEAAGCRRPGYTGLQTEDKATGYVFLNWDSRAHHQAVIDGPNYGRVLEALKPIFGDKKEMHHVIFNDLPIAFESPVTEVFICTLKDPGHREEVFDILAKISDKTEKKLVFGPTLENENVFIIVAGWDSVEAHWEMVAKPEPKALVERLFALANKDHLAHTSLTPYEGK